MKLDQLINTIDAALIHMSRRWHELKGVDVARKGDKVHVVFPDGSAFEISVREIV